MEIDRLNDFIEKLIDELESEYQQSQGLILSEGDLKCHVFRKLYSCFEHKNKTLDANINGSPLHSELPFFEIDNTLKFRPDICLMNTERLSILHSVDYDFNSNAGHFAKLSGKEFEFGGDAIVFELKFCKRKNGIYSSDMKRYKSDIEKFIHLQKVAQQKGSNFKGIFIIFNKADIGRNKIDHLYQYNSNNLKIIYRTGKVQF